jgi:hypothetical protein
VEDILRSRVRTTGIVEIGFKLRLDKKELCFQVELLIEGSVFCLSKKGFQLEVKDFSFYYTERLAELKWILFG